MTALTQRISTLLIERPGLSDREIADSLFGPGTAQQPVNSACHRLASEGLLSRSRRNDGRIGNYLAANKAAADPPMHREDSGPQLGEDSLKQILKIWLEGQGWQVEVKWGRAHGVDIEATRAQERWSIEVKGCGSRPEMRVNYFLMILGETLQRMDDPNRRYSIALPDHPQFRKLWNRLPALAKARTGISALFVTADGKIMIA
jgi:hypothetical protein